jgi:predicted O-methyltransferase YrrM
MRAKGVDDIDVILIEIPTEHHQQAREIWSKL